MRIKASTGWSSYKRIKGASEYKYVVLYVDEYNIEHWVARVTGFSPKECSTEREAAIAVDKMFLSKGKEPVNILKRKS
jgi:uncharacterized protein YlbG (UPF0298 family)